MNFFQTAGASNARTRVGRDFAERATDALPLADFSGVLLAGIFSSVTQALWSPAGIAAAFGSGRMSIALAVAVLAAFILYDEDFGTRICRREAGAWLGSFAIRILRLAAVVAVMAVASASFDVLPPAWLGLWAATSLALTAAARLVLARHLLATLRSGVVLETVALIGGGVQSDGLAGLLRQARFSGVEVMGRYDEPGASEAHGGTMLDGTLADLLRLCATRKVDRLLVTFPCEQQERLRRVVERLRPLGIPIGLCTDNLAHMRRDHPVEDFEGLPVVLLADRPIKRWDAVMKSAEDQVFGWLITLALMPVLAVIVLLIRLDSPGPVIFRQRRHGYNNREFDIYKFRTMRTAVASAPAGLQQTLRNDPRITRVGRYLRALSLDELPQLFNVLEGDMSLVGPRPHAVDMRTENRLCHDIIDVYPHRHRVKPGITGWAQVNGLRGATNTAEQVRRRVEHDLHYVKHWSLALDFRILLMTVREVMKRTNAF